jgi:hypothetical protein
MSLIEFIKTDLGQLLAWLITIIGGPPAIWFFWDKFSKRHKKDKQTITITPEARDILFPKTIDTPTLKTDIDRLPMPTAKLVGREIELTQLHFDRFTIARTLFAHGYFENALLEMGKTIQEIHKAGVILLIPILLLARANFLRHQKDFKAAQYDLDESFDIIERCGMKLYEVDANLLQGNLNLDQNKTADNEYKTAKELIAVTGYHLRDPELDLLGARLAFYKNEQGTAKYSLKNARDRLEKRGYWGLLPEWEWVEKELQPS